jgi:FixJ family two-component response regulator
LTKPIAAAQLIEAVRQACEPQVTPAKSAAGH